MDTPRVAAPPSRASHVELSVVIPVWNEARRILSAVASAAEASEVLVADGGSDDDTVRLARLAGARVVGSSRGRACQLRAAVAEARGAALVFLHADCELPRGFSDVVTRILADPTVAAGAFRLAIQGAGPALRTIERWANRRARWLHMPYGDQALFTTRRRLDAVGGIPELPILEDFELVRRLKRSGRIVIAPMAVRTSGRRWKRLGPWRVTAINQLAIAAYFAGGDPAAIARWYRRGRLLPGRRGPGLADPERAGMGRNPAQTPPSERAE